MFAADPQVNLEEGCTCIFFEIMDLTHFYRRDLLYVRAIDHRNLIAGQRAINRQSVACTAK